MIFVAAVVTDHHYYALGLNYHRFSKVEPCLVHDSSRHTNQLKVVHGFAEDLPKELKDTFNECLEAMATKLKPAKINSVVKINYLNYKPSVEAHCHPNMQMKDDLNSWRTTIVGQDVQVSADLFDQLKSIYMFQFR
jgi:hypothetical protein